MKKIILLIPIIILRAIPILGSLNENPPLTVYAVPGQNGLGSDSNYIREVLGNNNINIIDIETPIITPDLGQKHCQSFLSQVFENQEDQVGKKIIFAASQGTATTLNYLAKNNNIQIDAIILNSVLASGNSAIYHSATHPDVMGLSFLEKITFSRYWAPYIAKLIFFPRYSPGGEQVIKQLKNVPTNIPIIIVHSEDDIQIAYQDACALAHGLRENGNQVYLISPKSTAHINALNNMYNPKGNVDDNNNNKEKIRKILRQHDILPNDNYDNVINENLIEELPENSDTYYQELLSREKKFSVIGWGFNVSILALISYLGYKYIPQYLPESLTDKVKQIVNKEQTI